MNEARLLGEVAREMLSAEVGRDSDPWRPLIAAGWIGVGVDEARGGGGGGLADAAALAEASGTVGSRSPVTEAILAGILLGASPVAASALPDAISGERKATVVAGLPLRPVLIQEHTALVTLAGQLIPYGESAHRVVVPIALPGGKAAIGLAEIAATSISRTSNVAQEPRARVQEEAPGKVELVPIELSRNEVEDLAGTLCAARLLGAMRSATQLAVVYASERKQFGTPIGRFQAVAHALVDATGHVEQTASAVELAVHARLGSGAGVSARVIAGRGAAPVSAIAHQVHGAIGTTREHDLHRFTLRLSAWSNELGRTRAWACRLSERLVKDGNWAPFDADLDARYTLTDAS